MGHDTRDIYIEKILRCFPDPFTVEDFVYYLSCVGCEISTEEANNYIESSSCVIKLEGSYFITHAGLFSNKFFSVVLTKEEISNKCFLPGHRCIPFVDQEVYPHYYSFVYNGEFLNYKQGFFSTDTALEHYELFGPEYSVDFICNDPEMLNFDFRENGYDLPNEVKLRCADISELIEEHNLKAGDRLLLRVVNWDQCVIEIIPFTREKKETLELSKDFLERNRWFKKLEKYLLDGFDSFGPCNSIEQQLLNVFKDHIDELAIKNCGSIEEFLSWTKKVSIEEYGVTLRLWRTGELVPAFGPWNNFESNQSTEVDYEVPDFIIDEYIKDMAYQKKNYMDDMLSNIFPSSYKISDNHRNGLLLNIANRNDIILRRYNWFKDQQIGKVRHKALQVYKKVTFLIYEIKRVKCNFRFFPQQELVMLSQMDESLNKIILGISSEGFGNFDTEMYLQVLDGMEFNFDAIEQDLRTALFKCKKQEFKLVD